MALVAPGARAAFGSCLAGRCRWPLLLTGPVGTGKTRAALALLDYVPYGLYFDVPELCRLANDAECGRLRESELRGPGCATDALVTPRWLWACVRRAPLAVLDELGGRDRVSDAHYETVKRFLDVREGLPTVLCSNHSLNRLAHLYDDRVASRIGAGTVCVLDGPDRRQLK